VSARIYGLFVSFLENKTARFDSLLVMEHNHSSLVLLRRKLRGYSLLMLYAFVFLLGFSIPFTTSWSGPLSEVSLIFGSGAATYWAVEDSRIRNRPLHGIVVPLYFFSWPIASLVYLLASRRSQGALWWLLNLGGLFAVFMVALVLACAIVSALGWEIPWAKS
jgi:hypothetical protein